MKRTILSVMLAALTMGATAQSTDSSVKNDTTGTKKTVSEIAKTSPQFPGGQKALKKFFKKNVQYPDAAQDYDVEGQVIMTFFVNEDGSLSDISARDCKINRFNTTKFSLETESKQKELKEQFAKLFAKEAYRVIKKMPKWVPGKQNGKISRLRYNIHIDFVNPDK